jgi:pyruvate/2-oxoglutarate dehydrogenase complex dihydrolipoamide acyltransferase (E2) component
MHICVDQALWANSILPAGMVETWLQPDGAFVEQGEPLAVLRIEGALHELVAPANGWLTIDRKSSSVIEPGAVIGHIGREEEGA